VAEKLTTLESTLKDLGDKESSDVSALTTVNTEQSDLIASNQEGLSGKITTIETTATALDSRVTTVESSSSTQE
jgi:hypothetical protein